MKKITIILKASEVTTVRKAVCSAGGSRVVITPNSSRNSVELRDWNHGMPASTQNDQVRFDVTVDDEFSDSVISAIFSSASVGKIETIKLLPVRENRATLHALRHAA